jgi:hypothetical protein
LARIDNTAQSEAAEIRTVSELAFRGLIAAQYRATLTASLHARHDLDPDLLRRGRGGVLPRIGEKRRREYGNVQNPAEGFAATAIWWFAEGDPEAVNGLLRAIHRVGKKHTAGYGEVGQREVEPVDSVDGVLDRERYPLRPIPAEIYNGKADAVVTDAAWRTCSRPRSRPSPGARWGGQRKASSCG